MVEVQVQNLIFNKLGSVLVRFRGVGTLPTLQRYGRSNDVFVRVRVCVHGAARGSGEEGAT